MADTVVVVPQPLPWHRRLAAVVIAGFIWVCLKTWRLRWYDSGYSLDTKGPVIFCLWHNRQIATLVSNDEFINSRWPAKGMATMISASKDGSLVSNVVERFGIQPIRGSTSRRGPQALLEATTWMERGYNIVMFPDGPRGPIYQIKRGIIDLAKITGRPIIPVSNFTAWRISLGNWDRFQIPLPFARFQASFGEPIWVPGDSSDDEREQLRVKLENVMRALTKD